MNLDRGRRPPPHHPLGGRCGLTLPAAIVLTLVAMWRHRRELKEIV
jgi:hypothetical protein